MRPRRCRRIKGNPDCTYFKPEKTISKEEINLTLEELEAIRLKDHEELEQTKAAEKMNISQPTFHRILQEARKKIADALVNARPLRIYGGANKMAMRKFRCYACEHKWEVPYGTGRPDKCPKCNSINIHRSEEDRGFGRGTGICGRRQRGQGPAMQAMSQ